MLKYSVKDWKKLMPRTKFTAEDVIKYMQKTIFKDNYTTIKSNIVMRFENETRNSLVFRIHINDGFCLDIEEYDKSCYIFDVRKDKTIKMSYRNAFILLQNLEKRIKDIQFGDSWKAVMEIIKEYNEEQSKEDDLYCEKHKKAFLCGGDMIFYCPDCEKERKSKEDDGWEEYEDNIGTGAPNDKKKEEKPYTFKCKKCGKEIYISTLKPLLGEYFCPACIPDDEKEEPEEYLDL